MKCLIHPLDLKLMREFVIAEAPSVLVKRNHIISIDGLGLGEASGSVRQGPSPDTIVSELALVSDELSRTPADQLDKYILDLDARISRPAICAVSTALLDWHSTKAGIPLHKKLDLDPPVSSKTSVTVSVGDTRSAQEWVERGYDVIKIKMDADPARCRAAVEMTMKISGARFRFDANGSWSYHQALDILESFPRDKVEFVEQPLSPENPDDWRRLREHSPYPLIMDESVATAEDVRRVAPYVDGVNIKIQKSGRLETAVAAMREAKFRGMKVMLGCMIESSIGVAAAYQLASLADYLDLDGRLLLEGDPFVGLTYEAGYVKLSGRIGHGVSAA